MSRGGRGVAQWPGAMKASPRGPAEDVVAAYLDEWRVDVDVRRGGRLGAWSTRQWPEGLGKGGTGGGWKHAPTGGTGSAEDPGTSSKARGFGEMTKKDRITGGKCGPNAVLPPGHVGGGVDRPPDRIQEVRKKKKKTMDQGTRMCPPNQPHTLLDRPRDARATGADGEERTRL